MEEVKPKEMTCPFALEAMDKQTKAAGLGWRVVLTVVSWIILGYGIAAGNGFFVSLVLFSVPLLADYLRYNPNTPVRKAIKFIGVFASGFWTLVGFFGLTGIWSVISVDNLLYVRISDNFIDYKGQLFQLRVIWYIIAVSVGLTVIDWISNITCFEKFYVNKKIGNLDAKPLCDQNKQKEVVT